MTKDKCVACREPVVVKHGADEVKKEYILGVNHVDTKLDSEHTAGIDQEVYLRTWAKHFRLEEQDNE